MSKDKRRTECIDLVAIIARNINKRVLAPYAH